MTTARVCKICDCQVSTAQKWAQKHGVETIGDGTIKPLAFRWSQEKLAEFQKRPKPGRRWRREQNPPPDTDTTGRPPDSLPAPFEPSLLNHEDRADLPTGYEKPKTAAEVAAMFNCGERIVQRWCEHNDVQYLSSGHRKIWLFYPETIERFKNRAGRGRPKKDT